MSVEGGAAQSDPLDAHFLALADAARDAILSVDGAYPYRIFYANPAAARLFGWASAELRGMSLDRILPDLPQSPDTTTLEFRGRRKDGSTFPLDMKMIAWSARGARFLTFLIRDIEQRKAAEEELAVWRAIETAGAGLARLDDDGRYLTVNGAYAAIHGRFPDDFVGRSWRDFVQREDQVRIVDALDTMWASGRGEVEVRGVRPEGQLFDKQVIVVRAPQGGGFYCFGRDVTERRRREETRRQAQKMEAMGRLAGGVAHDFNNLLTAILGYANLALERLPAQAADRVELEEIRRAGDRAAALTRQLLTFSRRQVMEPRILDVNAVVQDVRLMLRRLIGEHVELVLDARATAPFVRADQSQLEQVVINLAVNARDAMPHAGRLTISTDNVRLEDKPCVLLQVCDTGVGIAPEVRAHLFEPFFTTKQPGAGTGLGLATVWGSVSQMGGRIDVESEPGHGTRFRIFLPQTDERPTPAVSMSPLAVAARGSEVIVICEDEAAVRALARTILSRHGYKVLEAAAADETLRLIREHPGVIDLLLTDVVMPGMSGPVLAREALKVRPELPVLFMSGYAPEALVHDGFMEAPAGLLAKPFKPEALLEKVRETLNRRAAR